jgi:metallo-beta-lactamase class B
MLKLGKYGKTFEPVKVDKPLLNGDTIRLGDTKLVMLHHPGHTKGSSSYRFEVKDEYKTYQVLIVNMPSIITEKKFSDIKAYKDSSAFTTSTNPAMRTIPKRLRIGPDMTELSMIWRANI